MMKARLCLMTAACLCMGGAQSRAHPGALSEYPERIPGKTLQQIRTEWEPDPAGAWTEADLLGLSQKIVKEWAAWSEAERGAQIQRLAVENRRGDYRKRFANLANDMSDLPPETPAQEAADYLAWRLDHLAEDDGFFDAMPESGRWDETAGEREERTRQWQQERQEAAQEILTRAEAAALPLRPHWLVQCGALEFKHRRHQEAAGYFKRVIDTCPKHPRAEVALLMLARIRLEAWRQEKRRAGSDVARLARLQNEWWEGLRRYKDAYPQGRYQTDLVGWEAGYFLEAGNLQAAMAGFLHQCGDPAHPEVRRRAFQQIEWLLRRLMDEPASLESLPWTEICREPCVALRMGYFMLDCRSSTDLGAIMLRRSGEDHRVLETLRPELTAVRDAARGAWGRLDQALCQNEAVYAGRSAAVRQTLHAWSATVQGHPGVAAGFLNGKTSGTGADDVALARVFALLGMGRHAEVVRAIQEFQREHGGSALNRGMTLRLADAWVDLGRSHSAVPLLWDVLEGTDIAVRKTEIEENPPLHLPGEVVQRLSALLSFAPLEQLEAAAREAAARPLLRAVLCGALRVRHLGEWSFDKSLQWSADADFEHWQPHFGGYGQASHTERASQWRHSVDQLRQAVPGKESNARAWIALGTKWRGHLWNLLTGGAVHLHGPYVAVPVPTVSHELRGHARYLHLTDAAAAAALDARQELTHARRCFEAALKAALPASAEAVQARDLLNQVLRQRAEFSPYFRDRAVEIGDGRLSAELAAHDPAAVAWTFQPAATLGRWQPGVSALWQVETEVAAKLGSGHPVEPLADRWQMESALKTLTARLKKAVEAGTSPAELKDIREAVNREAPVSKSAALLNHLDDLILLLQRPGVGRECFTAYATARLEGRPMSLDDPALAVVKDHASFWNAVITPAVSERDPAGWRQQTAQAQVARMTQFLADFPTSPKREAALARLAINTLRQYRCHCGMAYGDPVGNASTDYAGFFIERGLPFDRPAVTARIEAYEREFPQGRYMAEMRLLRGLAAAEAKEWQEALTHLTGLLNEQEQQDLHLDASNTVCAIFMELLDPPQRMAVKAAIEAVPAAREKLLLFMHTPSCGWQLRIMEEWILNWASQQR